MPSVRAAVLPALLVLAACSGGGTSSPPQDAAPETSEPDAGEDSGSCFPFCGSADASSPPVDASTSDAAPSCSQLKAAYEALQGPAQACNPQLQAQCTASTNGPCCPVTVSASNQAAVDNFDQAVAAYVTACSPDCTMIICMPAPSDQCQPLPGGMAQGSCK
jgi:hypothetical protein